MSDQLERFGQRAIQEKTYLQMEDVVAFIGEAKGPCKRICCRKLIGNDVNDIIARVNSGSPYFENPILVIPIGGDGSIHHAITLFGKHVYDANFKTSFEISEHAIETCINTSLFGVEHALEIRFSRKRKRNRGRHKRARRARRSRQRKLKRRRMDTR